MQQVLPWAPFGGPSLSVYLKKPLFLPPRGCEQVLSLDLPSGNGQRGMRWRSGVGARLRKAMERFRSQLAGHVQRYDNTRACPVPTRSVAMGPVAACIEVTLSNQPYRGRPVADVVKSTRCLSGSLSIEPRFRRACRQKTLASVHRPAAPALAPARCRCHARRRDRRRTRRS